MSPLWRDQLRIVLCPRQLLLLRLKRGLRPRVAAKHVIPCECPPGAPAWDAALRALAASAEKPEWREADAVVVLSNHFVRYLLTPWSDELSDDREHVEFARHGFSRIYGQSAEQWEVRLALDEVGATHVACAVDRRLIEGVQETSKKNRLRLISIQPYLIAALNQWCDRFREGSRWFVLAEHGRICFALLEHGRWRWLRCQRLPDETRPELPVLLEREEHMADAHGVSRTLLLHAPEWGTVPAVEGWTIQRLILPAQEGLSASADAAFSMAIHGAG